MRKNQKLTAFLLGFPGFLLAIAFILIAFHQNAIIQNKEANQFTFQKESLSIQGVGSSTRIQYKEITSLQLLKEVKTVRPIHEDYFNGICETKDYGDVNAYVYPKSKSYIFVQTEKKTYIFNEASKKKTKVLYKELKRKIK